MFCKYFYFLLIELSDIFHKETVTQGVFKSLLLISIGFLEKRHCINEKIF